MKTSELIGTITTGTPVGFRKLKVGEVIKATDIFRSIYDNKWEIATDHSTGYPYKSSISQYYRCCITKKGNILLKEISHG